MNNSIIIFTDGSSKGNPGPGGWGVIVASGNQVMELGGREDRTTNNRMELMAAIQAIKSLAHRTGNAVMYADSKYVIQGITAWVFGWQRNGWLTAAKQPVLNADLWKELVQAVRDCGAKLDWHYVGGHIGIPGNERVDAIASGFAEGKPVDLYEGSADHYPFDLASVAADASLAASKKDKSGKAYSYVSEVDAIIQTHKTWPECEQRVRGVKARFKKALSAEEESEIIKQFSK